ncbi:MlaD family protein [Patulibacter sp.]|uniref:MlaD family protein n=1 Tax=Patulibacter sp. TaxID=1912859 RepID=UPI0027187594|nr:MlaD family protein [Patulibacter sp.]MDO9409649.1 MlaD family protein [Patulibacter sp.]
MRRHVRSGRERATLVLGVLVVVALVALAVLRPWDRPSGPRITAVFDAVPGLVEGAEVQRAGVTVGRVERIGLQGDRPRVTLRLDDDEALHRGAVADLRMVSLSGQLNRVVTIRDGRGSALRDGATLGLARTEQPVEVEQVLSTLDPATRAAVRRMVRGAESTVDGRGGALAGTLRRARAALQATGDTVGDLTADGDALRRVVSSTRRVTSALAAAPGVTGTAVDRLASVLGDTAAEQEALGASLAALPAGLRAPRATLDRLRRQVPELRATVADARPAVAALRAVAPEARTTLAAARPTLRDVRGLTADGPRQLVAVRPLVDEATPLLRALRPTLDRANPMLDEARVRLPDFFSFFANWADFTSVYDRNGHGARVGIVLPPTPNRTASPDGQDAGSLARPFLRPPGSLENRSWTDYVQSFASKDPTP